MEKNIQQAIENTTTLEDIEERANQLKLDANKLRLNAAALRRKEQWKLFLMARMPFAIR